MLQEWYVDLTGERARPWIRTDPRVFFDHWNLSDNSMNENADVCANASHPMYPDTYPMVTITVDILDAMVKEYR